MKKRLLIALVAGGAVFATVFGVAASLNVTSDNLGAGGTAVTSCDDAVRATYTTKYVAGQGFLVDTVIVTGVDNACDGKNITVQLTGTSGNALGDPETRTIPTDNASTSVTVDFGAGNEQKASDVTDVHVVITG